MPLLTLLLAATAESFFATAPQQAWSPPPLITVSNATATELFAAGSLESRLRETLGLAAAHIVEASARTAHAAQLAVGYEASLAAGVSAEKLHGLGDDGYNLLPLKQGGVALGSAKDSARGALNAAYGLLRAGGMRFLQKNVTVMVSPRPPLNTSLLGQAVVVPFESRYALSRAGSPCSADHCPTNFSAALGFNGPHLHAPAPGMWTQVEALQSHTLPNGAVIGGDNSDIYDILAAGMLPLDPWVANCVNKTSVGWNTTVPGKSLREVPCPSVFRAHPDFFVCSRGQKGNGAPPGTGPVWPCTFDLMYQKKPFGYNRKERFSTGVAHMCWTGSDAVVPTIVKGIRAWADAAPEATIISLSEEDGGGPGVDSPGCPSDDALRKSAGTAAAPFFQVLNEVAAELAKTHPRVRIKAIAYNAALEYKSSLGKMHSNVIIQLCESGLDMSAPLADPRNARWHTRVIDWLGAATTVWIWSYTSMHSMLPNVNHWSVGEDITHLAKLGVKGYFAEGDGTPAKDLLLHYIIGRKAFDPTLSTNETIREFLVPYYGPAAADLIFQYYDLLAIAYRDAPTVNATWPPIAHDRGDHHPLNYGLPNSTAYPSRTVLEAGELLAKATAAVAGSPSGVQRMMELRLSINYLALLRWDGLKSFATTHKLGWPFGASKRAAFESFSQVLTSNWGDAGWLGKAPLVSRGNPQCDLTCFEKEVFGNAR